MDEAKEWEVEFTGIARKQRKLLPGKIREVLDLLVADLEKRGPEVQGCRISDCSKAGKQPIAFTITVI